jgi:hypothetical protein
MSVTRKLWVSAIFLFGALFVYFILTQRYPISGDDYSYNYQAKLFAAGRLYATDSLYDPALPFYDCLETYCLRDHQGHRFSKYPPGWPVLLAIGVKLQVPWLVDPLFGALLVFLILKYTQRRMGEELIPAASFLLVFCFFLCYYAGSFRAHIATALFVFVAFLIYDAAEKRPEHPKLWLFVAGALLGYSAMIRYLDWVPLTAWIGVSLLRRKKFPHLISFGFGFGLLASGNLIYNALLSSHPFCVPASIRPPSESMNDRLMLSWQGFVATFVRLANLLWVFPPLLLFVVLWRRYRPTPEAKMFLVLFSMNVAIYFFYPASVGGPGPRYFLAYFPFLVLATVDLYRSIQRDSSPALRYLWNFAMVALIVCNIIFAVNEGYTMYWRRDLDRAVRQIPEGKNIILLKTGTYKTAIGDLTRNPPELSSADILYIKWCDQSRLDALLKQFPGRSIFIYEYPGHLKSVPRIF